MDGEDDYDRGVWVDGRFHKKMPRVSDEDVERAHLEMGARINCVRRSEAGYRCDDCDHWWQDARRTIGNGKGRVHLLRYGCPECGGKSLTAEQGFWCGDCGGLIGSADWYDHKIRCSESET